MPTLINFFGANGFTPHGYCLAWSSALLWLHVLSDAFIVLAYYSIPLTLVYFVRQRKDLPYPWLFSMFGLFILACGTTHLFSMITIWVPLYWLDGIIKAITAIVSVASAALMFWVIPRALLLRSPAQLEAEVQEKTQSLALSIAKQKFTAESLRISEERLKIATDSGQVGIWDLDLQTNELIWDDTMFALYGARREDFSGAFDVWSTRQHPEDRAAIEAAVQDAISGIREFETEFRIIWPDNEVHYIKGHARVIMDSAGKPVRMIGTNWDNKAHALAKQQLQLAQVAINKSRSAFFWLNQEGEIADVNDYACKSLGYSREELIGEDVGVFDPDFSATAWSKFWIALKKEVILVFESRHRRKDGTVFPVEITANYVTINGEEYSFAFSHDISERKQAEERLRIAATAFESQQAMVITDADTVILQINSAFTDATGYIAEEAVGRKMNMFQSGRHDDAFYVAMWESINRTGTWQGEIWDRHKNGEIKPKWLTITAVKNADGVVTHYVGTHIDITARKLAEEEIKLLAFYDPLTQLANRRLLKERLKHSIDMAKRDGKQMALLMLDLDRFKAVNDSLGHLAGDELL